LGQILTKKGGYFAQDKTRNIHRVVKSLCRCSLKWMPYRRGKGRDSAETLEREMESGQCGGTRLERLLFGNRVVDRAVLFAGSARVTAICVDHKFAFYKLDPVLRAVFGAAAAFDAFFCDFV
jgi:hypothetical protein